MLTPINPGGKAPAAPYSHGMEAAGFKRMLFVSGQVGAGADGSVPAGVADQARNAGANLNAVLAEAGMTNANLAKVTIYLTDAAHLPEFMAGAVALPSPPPATTLLIVKALADPSLLVEIEAIAVA